MTLCLLTSLLHPNEDLRLFLSRNVEREPALLLGRKKSLNESARRCETSVPNSNKSGRRGENA